MTQESYKNLNKDELELADHYYETGNASALRELREESERRGTKNEPARWHHTHVNRS